MKQHTTTATSIAARDRRLALRIARLMRIGTVVAAELLVAHRQAVSRHGRGQKLAAGDGWAGAWSALHALNVSAWERRDLLLDVPEESPAGLHRPPPPT